MALKLKNIKSFIRFVKKKETITIKIKNHETDILINKNKKKYYTYISNKFYDNYNTSDNKNYFNKFENNQSLQKSSFNRSLINKCVSKIEDNTKKSTIYSTIVSPMVGTFYRSPAPNEQPFIEEHDIVKPKQTVCIIEAMKLMNEIEAEVNGEIVEVLVNDGDIVDCGQALMKVKTK